MNTYTILISILLGASLFFIFYNMTGLNRNFTDLFSDINKKILKIFDKEDIHSNNNPKSEQDPEKYRLKKLKRSLKVAGKKAKKENLLENEQEYENDIERYNLGSVKYSDRNSDDIDETRLHKSIDNSKYIIPVNDELYDNSNEMMKKVKGESHDPRMIFECGEKLDCNAKKRYDLLIEDDYESMNVFNDNCVQPVSSYDQTTNNPDISKDILNEDPDFYKDIQTTL